jgi:hypothetical protein
MIFTDFIFRVGIVAMFAIIFPVVLLVEIIPVVTVRTIRPNPFKSVILGLQFHVDLDVLFAVLCLPAVPRIPFVGFLTLAEPLLILVHEHISGND